MFQDQMFSYQCKHKILVLHVGNIFRLVCSAPRIISQSMELLVDVTNIFCIWEFTPYTLFMVFSWFFIGDTKYIIQTSYAFLSFILGPNNVITAWNHCGLACNYFLQYNYIALTFLDGFYCHKSILRKPLEM